jgi:hypothetical protein
MINAFLGKKFNKIEFIAGILQWCTFWLLIGYIGSIYWGIMIYQEGRKKRKV